MNAIKERLEYLRTELRAERISYSELAELQSLIPHIEEGDTELLEAAGVPEFKTIAPKDYIFEVLQKSLDFADKDDLMVIAEKIEDKLLQHYNFE